MAETANNKKRSNGAPRWPIVAMVIAILAITGFQGYWLNNNYEREKQNLEINTNAAFRQTVLRLQASKVKLDQLNFNFDTLKLNNLVMKTSKRLGRGVSVTARKKEPAITLYNLIQERMRDSFEKHNEKGAPRVTWNTSKEQTIITDTGANHNVAIRTHEGNMIAIGIDGKLDSIPTYFDKNDVGFRGEIRIDDNGGKGRRDEVRRFGRGWPGPPPPNSPIFRILYDIDSISMADSVTVKDVKDAYAKRLKEDNINVAFKVSRLDSTQMDMPNTVVVGLTKPSIFGFTLQNTFGYMFDKLKLPILFSLLLIGITIAAFVLLYRNMIKQHRLAALKNEFISNITHELKTPIATVGVAIEALKNFNAIDNPQRTREYLDISQNELQRLNLLVDKVLKLSVFENKAIELRKEIFDIRQLTEEIMNSMKLQFEKYKAVVSLQTEGSNFSIDADKLHITSVIYNLLDNALKYSQENPTIDVMIKSHEQYLSFSVKDNGIGIPQEYKNRIFEKFFRVPTGDKHNIKGYGLGLSYVSEIAKRHLGYITVESELGKGSIFTVNLPYKEAPVIEFDKNRKAKKEFRFGH